MELSLVHFLIVCPLVFIGGLLDAVAGGGGLITLPAYIIAGVPIHNALATNKLSSVLGAIVSTFRFWKNGCINVGLILPSVALALFGSMLGARLALMVDEKYLKYLLVPVLPIAACIVLRNKNFGETLEPLSRRKTAIVAALISLVIGSYDGFYGPGTGTFLLLLYVSLAKMDVRHANGNAKFVNFASNLGAITTFVFSGKLVVALGLTAAIFSILGHYVGAGLAIKRGATIVRPVIIVVLGLLFIRVITNGGS